jgi:ryanodine receptor 2
MKLPKLEELGDVKLPSELEKFIEDLAKQQHEVWAQSRIEQGWTYGPERNDQLKHHPCLVPYEELPEAEKAYDRDTAVGTLKLIQKLGFTITKE